MCVSIRNRTDKKESQLTILDAEQQIAEQVPALFVAVWVGVLLQANLHDDSLFAHLQHHVERIFFGVVEDLDQLDKVWMVQFLHDGYLFADKVERIVFLSWTLSSKLGCQRIATTLAAYRSTTRTSGALPEDARLRSFAKTSF